MLSMALPVFGRRLAPVTGGGSLSSDLTKGGLPVSTSEVLQLCLVIIGICSLFFSGKQKEVTARLPTCGYFF